MASIREIKRRKLSVQSTQQITKAMKLVATAKLQRAQTAAKDTRSYFQCIHETISSILAQSEGVSHPFLVQREGNRNLYLLISSNRGLAGGYNSNVSKMILQNSTDTSQAKVIAIGRRGEDFVKKRGYEIIGSYHEILDDSNYTQAMRLGEQVLEMYINNEVDNVYLAYTHFQSTLTQIPKLMKILPAEAGDFNDNVEAETVMTFEPSPEAVLESIVPKYLSSVIYGALKESVASEHGARMTAMDSATKNATEMIDKLSLEYNRARQSAITQEITEIVGGAEALG